MLSCVIIMIIITIISVVSMYGFLSSLGVDTTGITVKAREINIHRTILP